MARFPRDEAAGSRRCDGLRQARRFMRDAGALADNAAYRTKAIAAEDSAVRRVFRACAFIVCNGRCLCRHGKANKIDASDSQVKEWLPQFERLQSSCPNQRWTPDRKIAK